MFSAGSSLVSERIGRGWAFVESLRYYFAVNNSYVKNKLKLLLFPFLHKNWFRLTVAQGDNQESYRPPRDDINAPDMYIPLMSLITWVVVSGILLGANLRFKPEAFGSSLSKGIAVIVLEVLILKAGYYLLCDGPSPPSLVLGCYSAYKFVGVTINLIAFLLLGPSAYYLALIYTSLCSAFFMRGVMLVTWQSSQGGPAGKYFRLVVILLQFLFPLLLGWQ